MNLFVYVKQQHKVKLKTGKLWFVSANQVTLNENFIHTQMNAMCVYSAVLI